MPAASGHITISLMKAEFTGLCLHLHSQIHIQEGVTKKVRHGNRTTVFLAHISRIDCFILIISSLRRYVASLRSFVSVFCVM